MRFSLRAPLAGLALLALGTGCNKPKDSCEGTLHSFEGCVNSNDWDCFVELMNPDQRKRFGDRTVRAWAADNYTGARSFKFVQMNATETGNLCIAQTVADFEIKIRGKNPEPIKGEYFSYTLHQKDGLWYLDIPGSQKVQGY